MKKLTKFMITLLSVSMLTTLLAGAAWADSGNKQKNLSTGLQKQLIKKQYQEPYQPSRNYSVVFQDVNKHWAKNDILKLESKGIMKGYENKQFMPDKSVSKNEAIAIIMRVIDHEATSTEKEALLKQIFPGWMGLAPLQAYDAGILADWELMGWNGNKPATRIEAAMWLSRAAGDEDVSLTELLSFKDIKGLKQDELTYAATMYKRGILRGTSDGYLNPFNPITRGEFAVMISRFIDSVDMDIDLDEEEQTTDYISNLSPANKAKIDINTNKFTIHFTEDMVLAKGQDIEDLAKAIQLLQYKNGQWVDAQLEYAIVFKEDDDQLVVKLNNKEFLSANSKYCLTIDDDILVTRKARSFSGINKGEWYFTTKAVALAIDEVTATNDTTVVIQFNEDIQKGKKFNSNGTGIHILKGTRELDVTAARIAGAKLTLALDADDSMVDNKNYQVWLSEDVIDNFSLKKEKAIEFKYED
ncbi:S-layer homology domain-containing protein [Desulforamulus aeronauticus]|uniref:Ig-like domain-containing protein n=1 Tax=Desulforamulus aeronauticus DSM 10349 TaxID=1121421 RepID=A0A1M6SD46_9FIRM|nr:S-layer homology domain-containing protein [Desulforamulus aeronauticus]SHK42663.1 Ig-like domain-containing protein [Desulforamulus aeronauticus DSM 10349]